MKQFNEFVADHPRLESILIHSDDGMTVARLNLDSLSTALYLYISLKKREDIELTRSPLYIFSRFSTIAAKAFTVSKESPGNSVRTNSAFSSSATA